MTLSHDKPTMTANDESGPTEPNPRPSPVRTKRTRGLSRLASDQVSRFGGVYLFVIVIIVFGVWVPNTFLTAVTARSIAGDQAITVILALGLLIPLAAGSFDLSIAQNLGLGAAISAVLMSSHHLSLPVTAIVVCLVGLAIGIVNGVLVSWIGVNSFIATLGMSSVLLAVTEIVTSNSFVGPIPIKSQHIVTAQPLGIPILTIYALVTAVVAWYVLQHAPIGRRLQATGVNPDATRLAGIRTSRYIFWTLVVSGVVGSAAGLLVALKIGSVSPDVGPPYLLPAFAACFLGTTLFKPGRFNVWGTVLALYLLATGVKGLQLAGGQTWVTDMFNGVALILAVSIAVLSAKRRTRVTH